MKKIGTFIFALALGFGANAQDWIQDSVTLERGSVKQIYYSFETQQQYEADAVGWHLAFSVQPVQPPNNTLPATTIRFNNGKGIRIFKAPSTITSADFDALDTTGMLSTWEELFDSDSTWDIGAFNTGFDLTVPPSMGGPYYGWGNYDEISHDVISNESVYVVLQLVRNGDSICKKLYFGDLIADSAYSFTYDNLDNSDRHSEELTKSDYTDKFFAYYDLIGNQFKDLEPKKEDWDVVFISYWTLVHSPMGASQMMANPGTLSKKGVKVARIEGPNPDDAWDTPHDFTDNISTIGGDWKTHLFDSLGSRYVYNDTLSFIVDNGSGTKYLLHFTKYGGSANTKMNFSFQEKVFFDNVHTILGNKFEVNVYPNPVNSILNVEVEGNAKVQLLNMQGQIVLDTDINEANSQIDISSMNSGLYIIRIIKDQSVYTQKLIKTN